RRLVEREPARQVVVLPGPLSVDAVLGGAAARLRQHLIVTGTLTGLAWQAVQVAGRPDVPWGDRWALLRQHALELVPLLVVLDNFEDNLAPPNGDDGGWTIRDESLAELLAAWAASPGRSRLLVTSRYAFTLPGGGARRLRFHPVGPMSLAETYKLIWSLPVLARQDDAALGRVWRAVGGHPRSLEYLDALLAGGVGRFPDITERLTAAVRAKLGEAEADRWLATGRDLDAAVAEVVTLAADDVLLGEHLARLAATPDALRLLVGASVYREPVDLDALLFQIGEPEETRWRTAGAVVDRLLTPRGVDAEQLENLAVTTGQSEQVRQEVAEFVRRYRAAKRQPGTTTVDLRPLVGLLAATTLLSVDEQRSTFFVHRWTAAELERQWTAAGRSGGLRDAHRRAADYWIWRVNARSEDPHADVHDLLEARHHLLTVGDVQEAAELITRLVFMQFWTWGAWDRARSLALETIGSLPAGSSSLAEWSRHLGILSHARGDYAEADQLFRRSLQISE
ncbi:MAG TPA: hypothetical protein VGD43_24555, partial [Micromonospora sp.]